MVNWNNFIFLSNGYKKRPKKDLTLKEKYEIVLFLEKNSSMKHKDIASKFSVPESTLSRLASKVSELKKQYGENKISSSSKRIRTCTYEEVDTALLRWFTQLRATEPDFAISGEMLHTKGNTFMEMFGHETKVSMAWINRWKAHHLISSKKLVGEASSVNPSDLNEWYYNYTIAP